MEKDWVYVEENFSLLFARKEQVSSRRVETVFKIDKSKCVSSVPFTERRMTPGVIRIAKSLADIERFIISLFRRYPKEHL